MRRLFAWTAFFILLWLAALQWFLHMEQYRSMLGLLSDGLFPCSSPVTLSIGRIDDGYDLSRADLAAAISEAEALWERAGRRDLFRLLESSGDVTVNLVYDRRQAAMDQLKLLGLKADQGHASYKAMKEMYDALAALHDPRAAALKVRLAAYKAAEADYNAVVAVYNRRGTATRAEAAALENGRLRLQREFAELKQEQDQLNSGVDTLNALATALNQLIVELQLDAEQYNREGAELGIYEEGLYRVSGGFRSIDLYKYTGRAQLARLLAHEMGHAVGADHVTDPAALMYPLNRGEELLLKPDDLAELDRACTSPLRRKKRPPVELDLRHRDKGAAPAAQAN